MSVKKPGLFLSVFGLLLLLTPAVAAQTSSLVPGAITVVGEGSASAPATTADVIIVIGGDSNVYIEPVPADSGTPAITTPTAVDATAVVDAIVASGIPAENVQIMPTTFQGEWGSGMPPMPVSIHVTVTNPTVEDLSALLDLTRATASSEGLFVNQFSAMYSVEDCRSLHQQARVNAVAQARLNAEDQAAAIEVPVGKIVASRDTMPMNIGIFQSNGCTMSPEAMPLSMKYSAPQFDPGQPAEVIVTAAVEISFEIP